MASSFEAAELAVVKPLAVQGSRRWRGLVLPVVAVALWWLLSRLDVVNSALLVSPAKVAGTAWEMVATGRVWRALSASLARELTGFFIGTAAGLVLGALLGLWPRFNRMVGPSFNTVACGNMMEAMKWEKRMETAFTHLGAWFQDGRGWGDLPAGTGLHWPVPYQDLQARNRPLSAIYSTGGGSNPASAPKGTYGW